MITEQKPQRGKSGDRLTGSGGDFNLNTKAITGQNFGLNTPGVNIQKQITARLFANITPHFKLSTARFTLKGDTRDVSHQSGQKNISKSPLLRGRHNPSVSVKAASDVMDKSSLQEKRNTATFGSVQGSIWMSEDFDAPLSEFEDY